ncbi:MAG: molybdopterin molybdotransferase MoeA [Deltaproteobacteria bacterium]|nr:MAG: molybdopterin molybdotransferase MoeA [Deltaproteobacteria bacterium]
MKTGFFKVKTREEVWDEFQRFPLLPSEEIHIRQALSRVLAEPIVANEDLPAFIRSTVDGYAVRAKDTFGASESLPSLLEITGEVGMGETPAFELRNGKAARIPTGGMIPTGADSVVMVEYTEELDQRSVAVSRSVAPLENVVRPGDDFRAGQEVLQAGKRLRAQEIGLLAGLGQQSIRVRQKPKVAIISTGDEIVPMEQEPRPGDLRDINSHSLAAMVVNWGGEPVQLGLAPDQFQAMKEKCQEALNQADICLISGGSSVGTRDLTLEVLGSFNDSAVLVHGVAISPGKPTLLVQTSEKAFWGLPGHVASAMVVFQVLVRPFMSHLSGTTLSLGEGRPVQARLSRNVASKQGRDDFIRVKLREKDGNLEADPIFGESALISTLVHADGLVRIHRHAEGLYAGEVVEVIGI